MVGAPTHPTFALTDHFGHPVTQDDYAGLFRLVYFGFTSCRMVCPRALGKLSDVMGELDKGEADRIRPLYITVDPDRDTPEAMKAYLNARYPAFLGLTGSQEAIEAAKKSFRIFAQRKADPSDPDGYQVAHTAIAYLLDQKGNYLDHFPDAAPEEKIITAIRAHLAHSSI